MYILCSHKLTVKYLKSCNTFYINIFCTGVDIIIPIYNQNTERESTSCSRANRLNLSSCIIILCFRKLQRLRRHCLRGINTEYYFLRSTKQHYVIILPIYIGTWCLNNEQNFLNKNFIGHIEIYDDGPIALKVRLKLKGVSMQCWQSTFTSNTYRVGLYLSSWRYIRKL